MLRLQLNEINRQQEQFENENTPLDNSLSNLEETSAPTIPASALSPSSEEIQLSFQEGTSLIISHSQLALLREKSHYFNNLWSGKFQETLQHPLDLTQKDFRLLLNCLTDANFNVPLEEITSTIQLAAYYELTEVVENLEAQLVEGYKSQRFEPFNFTEESLVSLKKLLNLTQQCRLNTLKNYLECAAVSVLLNKIDDLTEFEEFLNLFSNEIEGGIESLDFSNNAYLTDAHLLALKDCKNLKMLHLMSCQAITDDGLAHLRTLTGLQHLNLNRCTKITDAGLAHLALLVALQHLDLSDCWKLTRAGLAHLRTLVALKHLNLGGWMYLTDAGLTHLTPLRALQHLYLSNCDELTGAGLTHLTPLIALQHLGLSGCQKLTDAGLVHLTPLTSLQSLNLSDCKNLTDAGLRHLKPLTGLQHLGLILCENLTDAGLAHFKTLAASHNLKIIK
ncbi:BTB/POZ domain-containing protein [Candidatus Protochlamydia sp. R18]|uniref:BTB/POZ domain-containing protein n=1 Tax=Candidatus Protochlamydia sp. R18 TaxID=1353977 RepID=UPI0009AC2265